MNKVFLIGNLTRDPELTETATGVSVCHFAIAVNRSYTNGDGERQTDFFNCTAWRGLADNIARYCRKGAKVAVTGSIQIRNYEDNNGMTRTAVDVVVQDCEFISSSKKESSETSSDNTPRQPTSSGGGRRSEVREYDDDGDIPF